MTETTGTLSITYPSEFQDPFFDDFEDMLTAANGIVLTFTATTGIAVGMRVSGTGILADTFVIALTGTTTTLSRSSTAGVGSGVSITFNYDMTLDAATIATGQVVTVQTYALSVGGA
jgi:hypothetical protein